MKNTELLAESNKSCLDRKERKRKGERNKHHNLSQDKLFTINKDYSCNISKERITKL
jgi:hypothetical protein